MTDANTKDAKKIAFKAELLVKQLGLSAALAGTFAERVHMVKAADRPERPHRIMCADGGWVEIDPKTRRVLRTWGPGRTRHEIASAISGFDSTFAEHLEEEVGAASAPGAPIRSTPVLSDGQTKSLADGWRQRGYTDLIEDERGVWVALPDGTRLFDVGRRVHIHGPRTDAALAAIAEKARDDWNGALALRGPGRDWPARDKERLWLACQREGVEYADYTPSAELVARWEAEQAKSMRGSARPDDDDVSAGPAAPGNTAPEAPAEPAKPDTDADAALARNAARAQADLDALHERWAGEARTEENRDRLRHEEETLKAKLAIYERARDLAREQGLSREDAIRAAYAEAQAERGYEPEAGLRI